jgi:hypothetical protein
MFVLLVLALLLLQDAKHQQDQIRSAKPNLLNDGVADTLVSVGASCLLGELARRAKLRTE